MATQSGTYDFGPVADAAGKANNYITDLGTDGIRVHPEGDTDNYAAIDADGMSVVRDAQSVAHFGETTRIGREGESRILQDYHSMQMVDAEGNTYFHVSDLRDASGNVDVSTTRVGNGSTTVFRFDYTVDLSTVAVTVDGAEVTSGWTATNPEGPLYNETQVTFDAAPASGSVVVLTGTVTDATVTAQMKAYTLGTRAGTGGAYSLVTGTQGTASGARSQAHGIGTRATHPNEVALGRYNTGAGALSGRWADSFNGVAVIVGNGTSDIARSNALEVDWDGNVTAAGRVRGSGPEVLWSGANYMNASQTITLSETLTSQPNGIVLHWQPYSGGAQNNSHHYTFVPKTHTGGSVSSGLLLSHSGTAGRKILTIATSGVTTITGDASNVGTHTAAGISLSNSSWVLTEVLGV